MRRIELVEMRRIELVEMNLMPTPITLYIKEIDTAPKLEPRYKYRQTHIDVEIPRDQIKQLIEALKERLATDIPGTMRIRFTGRLQL